MSSLGPYLRGLREAKGMSLDDIARSTRVGRRHLEALETDTLAELPAPVFVKGFIRAYCEFLDSSPEEALGLYRAATGEPVPSHGTVRPLQTSRSRLAGPLAITIMLFLALGVSLFALRLGMPSHKAMVPTPPPSVEEVKKVAPPAGAPAGAVVSAPSPQPSPPATVTPAPAPAVAAPSPSPALPADPAPPPATVPSAADAKIVNHRLVVRAVEATWLRVQVDDGQVSEELLQSGAVREWSASRRFTLTVGNAGGVEIDIDGKRMPSLGAKGAVIQRLVLPQETPGAGS